MERNPLPDLAWAEHPQINNNKRDSIVAPAAKPKQNTASRIASKLKNFIGGEKNQQSPKLKTPVPPSYPRERPIIHEEPLEEPRYQVLKTLRSTLLGQVKLARCKDGQLVAVKLSKIDHQRRELLLENPERELEILSQLNQGNDGQGHPRVLRLFESGRDADILWTVLEYASQGELFDILSNLGRMDEDIARYFIGQFAWGVDYMHAHNIAHLDLSLENLLVDHNDELKICDFGVAGPFDPETGCMLESGAKHKPGKRGYMAPEVFAGNDLKTIDGRKADVWSLGVCMFMLVVGLCPFEAPSPDDERFKMIMQGQTRQLLQMWNRDTLSSEAIDLLEHIFCPAEARFTITDVLNHPWLRPRE